MRPIAAAVSSSARPSGSRSHAAVVGSPRGPWTDASSHSPPRAPATAARVPSPPSASGSSAMSAAGSTLRTPAAIAMPASTEVRVPFHLSEATRILIVQPSPDDLPLGDHDEPRLRDGEAAGILLRVVADADMRR